MRVLTPMLLLVGCQLRSVESFTGLAFSPRATQRQAYRTSLATNVRQRPRTVTTVKMAVKPPAEAGLAKEAKVDPAVVEAALVEEDKNV